LLVAARRLPQTGHYGDAAWVALGRCDSVRPGTRWLITWRSAVS